jgi:hypothetical protein
MARNALLIWSSVVFLCALPALAQDDSARLIRALELKRSDAVAVAEPDPFIAPRIKDRVRVLANLNASAHSIDVIVLYDALHGVEHRAEFYPKLLNLLRPGGRVVNIDRSADLLEAQAVQEFTAAGFHITKTIGLLPFQYFQMFEIGPRTPQR